MTPRLEQKYATWLEIFVGILSFSMRNFSSMVWFKLQLNAVEILIATQGSLHVSLSVMRVSTMTSCTSIYVHALSCLSNYWKTLKKRQELMQLEHSETSSETLMRSVRTWLGTELCNNCLMLSQTIKVHRSPQEESPSFQLVIYVFTKSAERLWKKWASDTTSLRLQKTLPAVINKSLSMLHELFRNSTWTPLHDPQFPS